MGLRMRWATVACAAASVAVMQPLAQQRDAASGVAGTPVVLSPTDHPMLSRQAADLWLAPDDARR